MFSPAKYTGPPKYLLLPFASRSRRHVFDFPNPPVSLTHKGSLTVVASIEVIVTFTESPHTRPPGVSTAYLIVYSPGNGMFIVSVNLVELPEGDDQ